MLQDELKHTKLSFLSDIQTRVEKVVTLQSQLSEAQEVAERLVQEKQILSRSSSRASLGLSDASGTGSGLGLGGVDLQRVLMKTAALENHIQQAQLASQKVSFFLVFQFILFTKLLIFYIHVFTFSFFSFCHFTVIGREW